jgi:predicted enzyme related to lactoylglutathione lyase
MTENAAKLSFVKLIVNDLGRCAAFYRDLCGLREALRLDNTMIEGRPLSEVVFHPASEGGASLVVMKFLDRKKRPASDQVILVFTTGDLDAFITRIESLGGRITQKPHIRPRGRAAFFEDPEGNLVEVAELFDTTRPATPSCPCTDM